MAAGTFTFFDHVAEKIADGTIDLDGDTFKLMLLDDGYTPSAAHDEYSDVSGDEIANGSGYTTAGQALTSVTWGQTGGVATFDSDPVIWTASGGPITARYAILFDDTVTGDPLIGYFLLDNSPADVTATDGNTLTVTPHNTQGWFQLTVNPT